MAYRAIRVFDIKQEKRKPIGGVKGAVLEDDRGRQFLQLKLKNNTSKFLDQVPILIDYYDAEGTYMGTQEYMYEKIFARKGESFGAGDAIPLEVPDMESISIRRGHNSQWAKNFNAENGRKWIVAAAVGGILARMMFMVIQMYELVG